MPAVSQVDVETGFIHPAGGLGGEIPCAYIGHHPCLPAAEFIQLVRVGQPVSKPDIQHRKAEGQDSDRMVAHVR
ncbi:hypothetical protein D3C80_730600 [compost metagenome]